MEQDGLLFQAVGIVRFLRILPSFLLMLGIASLKMYFSLSHQVVILQEHYNF